MTKLQLALAGLTYAPPASETPVARGGLVTATSGTMTATVAPPTDVKTLLSMEDEDMNPDQVACR